jgi:hypothetical protein
MNRPTPISVFSDQRRTEPTKFPLFFLRHLLRHQLRQDLIFALHQLLQRLGPFLLLLDLAATTFPRPESGRSVLQELFLPAAEHRGLQAQFLAQITPKPEQKKGVSEETVTVKKAKADAALEAPTATRPESGRPLPEAVVVSL